MITKIAADNLIRPLPKFNLNGVWFAGGCVRDSLINEKPSDIDIFGPLDLLNKFIKDNLTTSQLIHSSALVNSYMVGEFKVQVIFRDYKTIEDCINSFDYTICMFAYDGNEIICDSNALLHLFNKKLVINKLNPEFVVNSLQRAQKYIKKGYTICNGGIKTLVDTIRAVPQPQIDNQFQYYPDGTPRIIRFD